MKRILVIEDDAAICANVVELLSAESFSVESAGDGETGVMSATAGPPDLVICDIGLPRLDGFGVLEKLRATPKTAGIPFIFLSARADRSDVRQGMKLGADDYLTKPFSNAELLEVVKARLARQEATARQLEAVAPRGLTFSPGQPQVLRVIEEEPATTPRYMIEELLGEGGMGSVYRAFDRKLQRKIALKVLHRELVEAGEGEERLLREARASAKLEHPNAVAVYDVGESVDGPFLAMELVAGKTLRAYIGVESIPTARRVRWLLEAARALGAAHGRGLVHRDVKPENVMVRDEDGVVKVLDFGIARDAMPTGSAANLAGTPGAGSRLEGTPFYMAPERLQGNRSDHRGDQFAWGVVAFELLAGRLPWITKGSAMAQIVAMMTEKAPTLASLGVYAPPGVAATIARTLAQNPDDRFRSMDEVVKAIEPFSETAAVAISLHATVPAHLAPTSPASQAQGLSRVSSPSSEPRPESRSSAPSSAPAPAPAPARDRKPPAPIAPAKGLKATAVIASVLAILVLAAMAYALTRR